MCFQKQATTCRDNLALSIATIGTGNLFAQSENLIETPAAVAVCATRDSRLTTRTCNLTYRGGSPLALSVCREHHLGDQPFQAGAEHTIDLPRDRNVFQEPARYARLHNDSAAVD